MGEEQKKESTAVVSQGKKTLKHYIDERRPEITAMLPSHVNVERFLKSALLAVARDPKLQACTPLSLFTAVLNAAELGLDFTPARGAAYLIKYGDIATFMPGYRGLIDLAKRTGDVSRIEAHLVYENDKFELEYGAESKLTHVPELRKERGKMIGVYAVANFKNGESQFEYMSKQQVDDIRKRSKAAGNGPWVTDYEEMSRKTALRRLYKYLPSSSDLLDKAIEADNKAIGLAEFSIEPLEPLEDGEKTSRLADRLAEKITPELQDNIEDVTVQETVTTPEPPKRGRPPKQEATVSKTEQVEPVNAVNYIAMLQEEAKRYNEIKLVAARKALDIRKLNITDFTHEEAKSVLLWLEQNAEKGE